MHQELQTVGQSKRKATSSSAPGAIGELGARSVPLLLLLCLDTLRTGAIQKKKKKINRPNLRQLLLEIPA